MSSHKNRFYIQMTQLEALNPRRQREKEEEKKMNVTHEKA